MEKSAAMGARAAAVRRLIGAGGRVMRVPESILIVGVARNCARTLGPEIRRLAAAFRFARKIQWLVVESDSSDNSAQVLRELENTVQGFRAIALGHLGGPSRTARLALCRNRYLDELRGCPDYADVECVVVSDLDGTNRYLTEAGVLSCFARNGWDVCCANQRAPYFDIWALRHPTWSPGDCLVQLRQLRQAGEGEEAALRAAIYSKMIRIPPRRDWIEVDSAFGGLAIYRRDVLAGTGYKGSTEDNQPQCEHVPLHLQIRARGGRIFINPALLNCGYNRHSIETLPGAFLYRGALRWRRWAIDRSSR